MTKSYEEPDSGVGAAYSRKGNRKVGEGNMAITDASQPDRVGKDFEKGLARPKADVEA
jgi:hypothetical protein